MTPPAPATGWDDLDCPRCRGGGCEECDNTGRRMVKMPLSDVNDLDAVVHVLGIEDSDTTPAEAVKELHAEIERLRTTAPSAEAMRERRKGSSPIRVKPGQSLAEILAARTPKDYAIEFGEYLATASERFISATNRWHHAAAGWDAESADGFRRYQRIQVAELRPWREGDDLTRVSVSAVDREEGSPRCGDMIARNPKIHADQWLIAAQYFADNFEPADVTWAPEVWAVARAICEADSYAWDGISKERYQKYLGMTRAALSASPLPEALALIERLIARRVTMADSRAWDMAVADAAAFLARVRERKDRP